MSPVIEGSTFGENASRSALNLHQQMNSQTSQFEEYQQQGNPTSNSVRQSEEGNAPQHPKNGKRIRLAQQSPERADKRRHQNRESARRYRQRQKQARNDLQQKLEHRQKQLDTIRLDSAQKKGEINQLWVNRVMIKNRVDEMLMENYQMLRKLQQGVYRYPVVRRMAEHMFGESSVAALDHVVESMRIERGQLSDVPIPDIPTVDLLGDPIRSQCTGNQAQFISSNIPQFHQSQDEQLNLDLGQPNLDPALIRSLALQSRIQGGNF